MATPATPASSFTTTLLANDPNMMSQAAEATKYKAFIAAAATDFQLPVCVVCGIGSRESHWGLILKPPGPAGTGDFAPRQSTNQFRTGPMPPDGLGFGRGLMQIDFDFQEFARTGNWQDPEANIREGCNLLSQAVKFFSKQSNLNVTPLRAAIAAYNAGAGGVLSSLKRGLDVDARTTGKNYSADVLNRAGWFQAAGW